jgi:hypothetical protein
LPSNITHGNSYDFGNFDECLALHYESGLKDIGTIKGQHCMIQLYSTGNDVISSVPTKSFLNAGWKDLDVRSGVGVCFPASCSPYDIREIVSELLDGTDLKVARDYNQADYCKKAQSFEFGFVELSMIFTIVILMSLAIVSTMKDLKGGKMNKWIKPFSIWTNGKNLCNIESDKSPDSISCLNGLRAITAISIIFIHCYFFRLFFPIRNPNQRDEYLSSPASAIPIGMTLTVDTFFVISAALTTRSIFKKLNDRRSNIVAFIIHRYMRLTPMLAFSIFAILFLSSWMSSASPFLLHSSLVIPCKKHLLSTLLHLQTYVNYNDMCYPLTWYISDEWQMFLMALIIIYATWRCGNKFLIALSMLVMVSSHFSYQYALEHKIIIKDLSL